MVKEHLGGIYDFLQKKSLSLDSSSKERGTSRLDALFASPNKKAASSSSLPSGEEAGERPEQLSYAQQKELNKRLKKLERRVADCEAEIEQTESAIAILEARMATPEGASDMTLYEQHQKLKQQLDSAMEEWDAASTEWEEAKK